MSSVESAYDIGEPVLNEIWIDPVNGNDSNTGTTPALALRTLTEAWARTENLTTTGYRLNLMPGTYLCEPDEIDNCLNYFGDRAGSYQRPLIIQAVNGQHTVVIRGGFDFRNISYLYLIDLDLSGGGTIPVNISGNNLLHLASADHILLRGLSVIGPECDNDQCNNLQEVLKVNQAQYIYVENSEFGGAWHSVVDYFSVQYGHFINNNIHTAGQWGMYIKGGSAYLNIEGNEIHDSYLGFQAGQSANLAMMQSPWIHYEVYDIKFINNIMHNIEGVGISVAGGYNILIAHNTLYKVGTDKANGFALFQTVFGERGCSATDELPNPSSVCNEIVDMGGWGIASESENIESIPNKNIFLYNNIFYNPSNQQTLYTHFTILSSRERPLGFQNIPNPINTDNNLVIRGNLIWNGQTNHPLGIDNDSGCTSSNPTCNITNILAQNTINSIEPQLTNPEQGDFSPMLNGNLSKNIAVTTYSIPDFSWSDSPEKPLVPQGNLSNSVNIDRDGIVRGNSDIPGAYSSNSVKPTLPESINSYKVLTAQSNQLTINYGDYVKVFGSGANNINIKSGGRVECVNFVGSNIITIEDNLSDFTVYRSGATVYLESSTKGTKIKIPATKTSQLLKFNNGSSTLSLVINSGKVMLGTQEIGLKAASH